MPLQKLTFKPGVNRENTRYTQEGSWWDMDKIRFRSGTPEKIGGWISLGSATFKGYARFLHNWMTLGSENLLAVGTNLKFYIERGQQYFDVTPIRYTTGALTNPFKTTTASSCTVTVASHGAIANDFVTFSGATGFDSILAATLNSEFQITSIVDANTFTIDLVSGGSNISGGGAAVVAAFQINTGPTISVYGTGWGVGLWGSGGWGLAASGTGVVTNGMRVWEGMDFGQDFIHIIRDGGIYYWSASSGGSITTALATRSAPLYSIGGASDAPRVADNILVTDQEFVVAIGTNALGDGTYTEDPLLIRWSDQGNPLNWTPDVTNQAGDQRLTSGSYTFAAAKMRQENLIWTDTSLISMQYVGPPVVFSFTTLATNISIASPNAVGVANNIAYWMGKDKFYVYNGTVQTLPCDVRKYVFSNVNFSQLPQVFAGTNAQFNEVTWWYCSTDAMAPDSYVTFNYLENLWTFGTMARTAWLESALRQAPMAASTDGKIYYHESGFDDGSTSPVSAILAYLESADFDIGDGQSFSFIHRIIPDIDFDGSTATTPSAIITLKARPTPGSNFNQTKTNTVSQTAVVPFNQFTEMCYTRIRGRQMVFRVESTDVGVTWQLGTPRLDLREDGQK